MERIGIYGGTFDPIHYGHLLLAESAREEAQLSQVVFMPAKVSPFKLNMEISKPEHRVGMLRAAIASNEKFALSDMELVSQGVSYTIHTLEKCRTLYGPDVQLYFIIGTDAFLGIEKWAGAEQLLTRFSFIVGSRPGYREGELLDQIQRLSAMYQTEVVQVQMMKMDVSSTSIRQRVREGRSIRYLLPESVADYICKKGLYCKKESTKSV